MFGVALLFALAVAYLIVSGRNWRAARRRGRWSAADDQSVARYVRQFKES